MNRYRIAAAATEPVSLDEAKLAARIDTDALDAWLAGLITSAREQAEHVTGRLFGEQTWRVELEDWPAPGEMLPVHGPVAVRTSYWDGAAWTAPATLPPACWAAQGAGTLVAAPPEGWPAPGARAVGPRVRIDITAGEQADESVRLYIKASVAHWVASPAAAQPGPLERNPLFDRLLDRARVY